MKKQILILALVFITTTLFSQEIKKILGAKGRYNITGEVSEELAKQKALAEAKLDALKKAGVAEHISSTEMLSKSEIGDKFEEVFMSEKQSEIRGAVQDFSSQYEKGIDEFKNFYVEAIIDADVIIYKTSADPAFDAYIDGIKPVYQSGELFSFSVKPTLDCYLTIFNIYEKNASLNFPNPWEKQIKLEGGKTYTFPLDQSIEYPLEKTTKEPERNKMGFVFTKDLIPYVRFVGEEQTTTFEQIYSWMYSITPDRRTSQFVSFVIY